MVETQAPLGPPPPTESDEQKWRKWIHDKDTEAAANTFQKFVQAAIDLKESTQKATELDLSYNGLRKKCNDFIDTLRKLKSKGNITIESLDKLYKPLCKLNIKVIQKAAQNFAAMGAALANLRENDKPNIQSQVWGGYIKNATKEEKEKFIAILNQIEIPKPRSLGAKIKSFLKRL